ncbi:T9SS type A sorting domain-containing protein [Chryseobacterium sp. JJR-5R]|uniref:T9SS type A sorting domain-containing protein n=1 Tax=Chryseobacterium sp. JJR-5R TaxID=3093923 RepID=UPI002A7478BB|nr:T9SS type A sorting domain-containing protein [Chryseobacterium sp. JJR-5R]WPO81305.1 T9SS type A sorting domain-containing protein [Chryseobacterium sp. JJR-5R]
MKKKLLYALLVCSHMAVAQIQIIQSENFSSFNLGNLSSDTTGGIPGQGGYYTSAGSATPADFQIGIFDAAHGNSLKLITGPGQPTPGPYADETNVHNRHAVKKINTVAAVGNNILSGSLEIYTGPSIGSGRIQFAVFDSTPKGIIGINYNYTTKKLGGSIRLSPVSVPAESNFYNIGLGSATYPANSWIPVSFTYNKTTGACTWTSPEGTFSFSNPNYSLKPGLTPGDFSIISYTLAGNTVANVSGVDNINLKFTNASVLSTNEIRHLENADPILYPNPTTGIFYVKTDENIKSVSVTDVFGKNIQLDKNHLDLRNLPAGVYVVTIELTSGIFKKKIIKK